MAISPTSISGLLNLVGPPGSPGMTVVADQNLTGGVTTGTPINQPDLYLPGGSHGTENDVLVDGAQQVVPFYDGTNYFQTSLPARQPPSFTTAPADMDLNAAPPDNFTVWNSAYQAQYFQNNIASAVNGELDIGTNKGTTIHVVLASTKDRVYVLENLQKNDFAKMPLADQQAIKATNYFQNVLSPSLHLDGNATSALAAIDAIISGLNAGTNYMDASGQSVDVSQMSTSDRKPFTDELQMLRDQITGTMAVYSAPDLANAIKAISDRLSLAARFSPFATINSYTGGIAYDASASTFPKLVSADGNQTIANGYRNLITQETQIRDIAVRAADLAKNGVIENKALDAPTLIFYFQLDANLTQEAAINASTEEVKQLNALLNLYSQMQGIINQTLEQFGDDPKQKLGLFGKSNWSDVPTTPPPSDQVIVSIFESDMAGSSAHPLETAYGIKKPTYNIVDNTPGVGTLNVFLKDSWNAFNSSLSDTVSQLNQQSQLKMNDINSATKQKDRHFDLANNALSKMSDMIQTIGRGLA